MKKVIMLIDDNITNLSVGKSVLREKYDVLTVPSGEKALAILERVTPSLILLDIEMPCMDGYETIKRIKANSRISHIPVIFLTARDSAESECDGLALGAADYIFKPFSAPLLLKRIELHLLVEEQRQLLRDCRCNRQKSDEFPAVPEENR